MPQVTLNENGTWTVTNGETHTFTNKTDLENYLDHLENQAPSNHQNLQQ